MADRNYKTGERVPEAGQYACAAGERISLRADENFPVCPIGGGETTWKRENR